MRLLLDTCIIIDALADRENASFAQELLLCGSEQKISLVVSSKSFLDIHYVLKKYLHSETQVRQALSSLLNAVFVCPTSGAAVISGLSSPTSDYEDAVQAEIALAEGVDYIVTRDDKGFALSPIKAIDAKEALRLFKEGQLKEFDTAA